MLGPVFGGNTQPYQPTQWYGSTEPGLLAVAGVQDHMVSSVEPYYGIIIGSG
jgi:hypothetical protein